MSNVSLINGHIDKTTNYDRIRNMSIDEMAKVLASATLCVNFGCKGLRCGCKECQELHKQWLESEAI